MARRSRSQRRKAVRAFVENRDIEGLINYSRSEPDAAPRIIALAFELDDTLRNRAIEALGRLAADLESDGGLEKVRGLIRRLLWLMNDESGGIAWHGPEAIAEILVNVPQLINEYGRILASFMDEDPFGPGAHRAVARVAPLNPGEFSHVTKRLKRSPTSSDPVERAFGLLGLSTLDNKAARLAARALLDDESFVPIYENDSGEMSTTTVGAIARDIAGSDVQAA